VRSNERIVPTAAKSREQRGKQSREPINNYGRIWDSGEMLVQNTDSGALIGMAFRRRCCLQCHVPIKIDARGDPVCPECGAVFDGKGPNGGWPFYSILMRG
jgi:hypothetical protein